VDCGGPCIEQKCADGKNCKGPGDCAGGRCEAGICTSCQDGKRNGTETDVDCGGGACAPCGNGKMCKGKTDCQGGGCEDGACCQANACGVCGQITAEVCDGKDNDCDWDIDEGLGPGKLCPKQGGVCKGAVEECRGVQGWVCDAQTYSAHDWRYAADEKLACKDGVDNDCDGLVDALDKADCCVKACSGKECGDDGCGGSCGTCAAGKTCTPAGKCVSGGTCGADPNQTCNGHCGGSGYSTGLPCACDYKCETNNDCCKDYADCCGGCMPNCIGKQCGSNGCSGLCGTCNAGYTCNDAGLCVKGATGCGASYPDCKACVCKADDYCCSAWDSQCTQECTSVAECVGVCGGSCSPNCTGKQCGGDGCGGSCGTCSAGYSCSSGTCTSGGDAAASPTRGAAREPP
jgi:hypothetical protein